MHCTLSWKHFRDTIRMETNGTRDFRIVSAVYFIFRLSVLLAYSGNRESFDHAYDWFTAAVILTSTSLFFAIARPYKVNRSNTIDSVLLALLSLQALMSMFVTYLTNQIQPGDCSDRDNNNWYSTCCPCIVHPVHHIKEDQKSLASEKKVSMSSLLDQILTD